MKHLLILFIFLFSSSFTILNAQNCCSDPNAKFAELGSAESFKMEHEIPTEINFIPQEGHEIKFQCPKGPEAKAYYVPSKTKSNKWLIVIQEWWGLNDHIKSESEKLWRELDNVNVLALDMYDGNVADNREDAAKYMQGLTKERAYSIISGMINYVGNDAELCTIGWCFGGGWSLQTAIESGTKTIGCVMYYGMPEEDISRLKKLNSDVLGIFAAQEKWINPTVVKEFEVNMNKANKALIVHSFDADHAFANPSSPRYEEKAAQSAYKITLAYLKKKFN
jgi:carboxymethylenebutenolidase